MTLIEGVGDEVVHFFILLVVLLVAIIAWWSTNISERHFVQTVVIVERRSRRTPVDTQVPPVEVAEEPPEQETAEVVEEREGDKTTPQPSAEAACTEATTGDVEVLSTDLLANGDELYNTMADLGILNDADRVLDDASITDEPSASVVPNTRLGTFDWLPEGSSNSQQDVQSQNESLIELIGQGTRETTTESTESSCEEPATDGSIRIRLKYLDDNQKLVEGKLTEQLGDFKKRHFSIELAGRKLVRLIFNGHVLLQDSKTLENYGLFDNCVVHCLVHQPRTPPPSPNLNRTGRTTESRNADSNTQSSWDLGYLLFCSISMILGIAWYGRYQYAQLYTTTTTVALVGLTAIFMVSLIGMYMPDTDIGLRS